VEQRDSQAQQSFAGIVSRPESLLDISEDIEERLSTGSYELDRVLGGGIVKGSLVLVGGDPGIGKSTLLLQIANNIGNKGKKSLICIRRRINRADKAEGIPNGHQIGEYISGIRKQHSEC